MPERGFRHLEPSKITAGGSFANPCVEVTTQAAYPNSALTVGDIAIPSFVRCPSVGAGALGRSGMAAPGLPPKAGSDVSFLVHPYCDAFYQIGRTEAIHWIRWR
jgi:hypothetical protein